MDELTTFNTPRTQVLKDVAYLIPDQILDNSYNYKTILFFLFIGYLFLSHMSHLLFHK